VVSLLAAWLALTVSVSVAEVWRHEPGAGGLPDVSAVEAEELVGPVPARIPLMAQRYRRDLLRPWRYYFALGEPASIGFGQVHQESRWDPLARSPVGASGLAQFMPATARWMHTLLPPDVRETCGDAGGCPLDPRWALHAMARFDSLLWRSYADVVPTERWAFALSAYNGGAGNLARERQRCTAAPDCDATRWTGHVAAQCQRRAAACRENRHYPVAILSTWEPMYRRWLAPA
jgi:soluble lytic murein transglycosylase-like protein